MTVNYLVWPEGRNLYAILRDENSNVLNLKKKKFVPYKEEDREKYVRNIKFVGGDLYKVPSPLATKQVMIIYEQQGPKPSKYDAVRAVFGDARFNYQDFCSNAKYSEKQKPRPCY